MCGRFNQRANAAEIAGLFDGLDPATIPEFRPRYNIAPTQQILVAGRNAKGIGVGFMRWGLVPSWAADDKGGARLINARADGVATKPSFRSAFKKRRCVIPATGFYEWVQTTGKKKQPIHFHRPDAKPFVFAGLWEKWGDSLLTCCLITADANATVSPFHDRMPVILSRAAMATWLDPEADPDQLHAVLTPAPDDFLDGEPVSPLLNSPKNDGPELLEPVAL